MATAPLLIAQSETAWISIGVHTTPSVTVVTGDVVVAYVCSEFARSGGPPSIENATYALSNAEGSAITWTVRAPDVDETATAEAGLWSATMTEDYPELTVSFTRSVPSGTGLSWPWLAGVLVFRGTDGIGASADAYAKSDPAEVNITTTGDESAVVVINSDFALVDGSSRVWHTAAGSLVELTYMSNPNIVFYLGYHPNTATAATSLVGLDSPINQDYTIGATEVLSGVLLDVYVGSLIVKRKR